MPWVSKHAEHVLIAGLAALFAPIADYEDHFAAGAVAPAQVKRRPQNRVIQYMRLFSRGVDRRWTRTPTGIPLIIGGSGPSGPPRTGAPLALPRTSFI